MADSSAHKKRKKQSEPRVCRRAPFSSNAQSQASPPLNSAETEVLRDQKIAPILAGLQAVDPAGRAQSLLAACAIIDDPLCRRLLLKEQIIRRVMEQSLVDPAQEVVTAGWRLLNKLVLLGGYDAAVHLYRQGILGLVDGILDNIDAALVKIQTDAKGVAQADQATLWDCTSTVVSLLTSFNETTQEIMQAISTRKILTLASKLLGPGGGIPESVTTAAVVFLDRVTDQNEAAYSLLSEDSNCIDRLLRLEAVEGDSALLQTAAACGTLHNLIVGAHSVSGDFADEYHVSPTRLAGSLTAVVRTGLSKPTLQTTQQALFTSIDALTDLTNHVVETFGRQVPSGVNGINGKADKMDEDEDSDDSMDEDEDAPREGDEDEDEDGDDDEGEGSNEDDGEDDEDDDDDDDELPDELGADLDMVAGEEGTAARSSRKKPLTSPELEYLTAHTIPTVLPIVTSTPSTDVERRLQLAALALLSSIARAFATLTPSSPSSSSNKTKFALQQSLVDAYLPVAHNIWTTVVTPILLSTSADVDLAAATATLSIHITAFAPTVSISAGQHRSFLALYNAAAAPVPLKVACIRVLAGLARGQGGGDRLAANTEIGTFFISTVNQLPYLGDAAPATVPPVEVVVACLDGVYDVYADREYDYDEEVFVKLGFLKYLRSFVGRVKGLAKKIDKRKQPALRESVDEALLNLDAFIRYKAGERV
ncbi:hypothetical protein DRE_01859 [Drechslerella stenobrocha 248]|uniref:SYO1-like TPR repeats domain-containing protein n=1 Tax=Drechslerella stenobrocha 248 TaxID=1043628 RepID=W7I984_9PEZI|nr:hypothetical protein DRE_01859 [Drechslerella stenobrocha 248]